MPASKTPKGTVDDYIQSFPPEVQTILKKLRTLVKKAAPGAEETISYGIPSYKFQGTYVAHFAAFKKHISLFPPTPKAFWKEAAQWANDKKNLLFPLDEPIPYDLVKRVVEYRVEQLKEKL